MGQGAVETTQIAPRMSLTRISKEDDTKLSPPAEQEAENQVVEKHYSIYTKYEKWVIVYIVSQAALFSPLTAGIYLPALPTIASTFNKSIELINLTVTVYMVLQAVAPMFWGTLADRLGRRPIFLACLLVLSGACAGLALVPTSDYWLLMLLRCIQAVGSSSTIALGAGVIGDIATRAERGSFFGFFGLGALFGHTFGPVIGGALSQNVGWRWIFWFLCISSAACLAATLMFLPETLRRLVGDGSVIPSKIYRPLIPLVWHGRQGATAEVSPPSPNPLRILTYLDLMNLLVFSGVLYSIFYAVVATIPTLFQSTYPFLNETEVGLCFIGIGVGPSVVVLIMKEKTTQEASANAEDPGRVEDVANDESFPIEMARLRLVSSQLIVFIACCAGYGWCLEKQVNIIVPLVLQIMFAAVVNSVQTLLIDLLPMQGSSVTACGNLVRCALGAATVSVINLLLNALGTGWTYILLAGINLATLPMVWFAIWVGPRCRAKRLARQNKITQTFLI
ncbi:major facilitator superfamily domain-containing protein [Melanogaster broomeanus]|nr:major facilitator superfamily domain-containing protein [Melanogaster broomeanus]